MSKGMTFIYHPKCPSCEKLLPAFRAVAKQKGIPFKKVNIQECELDVCKTAELVPTVLVDGRKLSGAEMERMIGG